MYLSGYMNILYLMEALAVNTVNTFCELNKRYDTRMCLVTYLDTF